MMYLPDFRKCHLLAKYIGVGSYQPGESSLLTIQGLCKPVVSSWQLQISHGVDDYAAAISDHYKSGHLLSIFFWRTSLSAHHWHQRNFLLFLVR